MTAEAQPYLRHERKDGEKRIKYGIIYFAFIKAVAIPPA